MVVKPRGHPLHQPPVGEMGKGKAANHLYYTPVDEYFGYRVFGS